MALQDLQWITFLIYIDGIIVFDKSFEEKIHRVEEVLERIKASSFKRRLRSLAILWGHKTQTHKHRKDCILACSKNSKASSTAGCHGFLLQGTRDFAHGGADKES